MKSTATKTKSSTSKTAKPKGPKVKAKSSAADGLRELFIDMLKDIYWAEKALLKALPKMSKNATSEDLIKAIDEHTAVTEEQVKRCEKILELRSEERRVGNKRI